MRLTTDSVKSPAEGTDAPALSGAALSILGLSDRAMITVLRRSGLTCQQIGDMIGASVASVWRVAEGQTGQLRQRAHTALQLAYLSTIRSGKGGGRRDNSDNCTSAAD